MPHHYIVIITAHHVAEGMPYLVHVGVDEDLEGPDGEGDVGGGGGDGQHVVVGLLAHVVGVDGLQQVSTGHRHHGGIHRELQLPRAQLRVRVHAGEPETASGARGNIASVRYVHRSIISQLLHDLHTTIFVNVQSYIC